MNQNQKEKSKFEKYFVIDRVLMHDCGIDWISSCGTTDTYEEAYKIFCKRKETLLQSMENYSKVIIKDNDDTFHIQYVGNNISAAYEYIKIINLY